MFLKPHKIRKLISLSRKMRSAKSGKNWSPPSPALWGMTARVGGDLMVGGCSCADLADRYGTPLHVMDEALLRDSYQRFHRAFADQDLPFEIYYSYKTNPVPGIVKVLHEEGSGAEVISHFELWLALESGVNPDAIIYNGPGKTVEGLTLAIQSGIRRININSFSELDLIESLARAFGSRPRVGVRLFTGLGWGDQFGLGIESGAARRIFEKLAGSDLVEVDGIHFHLGSQIGQTGLYERAAAITLEFMASIRDAFGIEISSLDMGGGFGVPTVRVYDRGDQWLQERLQSPYVPPTGEEIPSIEDFAGAIAGTIRESCTKHGLEIPTLVFEPGRIVSSSAGVLLARVTEIKDPRTQNPEIAILDTGINVASPVRWEYHEVLAATKITAAHERLYRIAGPICTPGDLLSPCKRMPVLQEGDVMAIMDAGAYFTAFENNFSFPRPAIVIASGGDYTLIREREKFDDLLKRDCWKKKSGETPRPCPETIREPVHR